MGLTAEEKDRKYGPVYQLLSEARKAHAALKKAASNPATPKEDLDTLGTAARAAKDAVNAALQSMKGNPDEVKQLLAYVTNVVVVTPLTPDGRGGNTYDYRQARWLAQVLHNVPADIMGTERENPAAHRLRSLEAFIELCEATSVVPQYGMSDRTLRHALGVLQTRITEASQEAGLAGKERARLLNDLYARVCRSVPKSWLVEPERQERPVHTATASIGEQVGAEVAGAVAGRAPAPRRASRRSR